MRSAPPLLVSVNRHEIWRLLVLLLVALASASIAMWWWAQAVPVPAWVSVAVVASGCALVVGASARWQARPLTLRWDRQRWLVACGGQTKQAGELAVAVDLGAWMLLHFVAVGDRPGQHMAAGRPVWIPLQRRGLESHLHLLRCALFARRVDAPAATAQATPK